MNAYTWSLVAVGVALLVVGLLLVANTRRAPSYTESQCPGCGAIRRQYSWDTGDALHAHTKHCDAYAEWSEYQEAAEYWNQP
jgi:hypothetical protein